MPAGKTSSPLRILVAPELVGSPEILLLAKQGHNVSSITDIDDVDLILAPQAHQYTSALALYLPAAIKAARARKRGKK